MNFKNKNHNSGFGLLEIIVGISVISISLFGLSSVSEISLRTMNEALNNTKASFLLDEGVEAVKSLRDSSWSLNIAPLTVSNFYYLSLYNSKWQATSSDNYIDGVFERKIVFESVNRNINDDIALSGTADPDTRKITVYVSWKTRTGTTTKQITGYITNLFNN